MPLIHRWTAILDNDLQTWLATLADIPLQSPQAFVILQAPVGQGGLGFLCHQHEAALHFLQAWHTASNQHLLQEGPLRFALQKHLGLQVFQPGQRCCYTPLITGRCSHVMSWSLPAPHRGNHMTTTCLHPRLPKPRDTTPSLEVSHMTGHSWSPSSMMLTITGCHQGPCVYCTVLCLTRLSRWYPPLRRHGQDTITLCPSMPPPLSCERQSSQHGPCMQPVAAYCSRLRVGRARVAHSSRGLPD